MHLQSLIEAFIHPAVRDSKRLGARHRAFVASHLFGPAFVLISLPFYFSLKGTPDWIATIAFLWLSSPLLVAALLRYTGHLQLCRAISLLNFTGMVVYLAAFTGGLHSFMLPWLVVIPGEAALSGRHRMIYAACGLSVAALLILWLLGTTGMLPESNFLAQSPGPFIALGAFGAIIYAGGMAVSANSFNRAAEMAAREGAARYRFLADHAADMILRQGPDGRVTYVSPASSSLLGMDPMEILGRRSFEFVHPEDSAKYEAAFMQATLNDIDMSLEYRLRHADGHYIWVETRLRPVPQIQNKSLHEFITISRDVTTHRHHAEELMTARDASEAANLAKSSFLAHMSHELRTPLNAIIGFSEVMSAEMFGPIHNERYKEYSTLIHGSGLHLLEIINDLLDMSKIEAGKYELTPELIHPGEIIQQVSDLIKIKAAAAGIELSIHLGHDISTIVADERALRQILLNLLSNAIKFSLRGGVITVSTEIENNEFVLSVSDTGTGIPEEAMSRIGKPFEQADNQHYTKSSEGSGLGLAVVRSLAELHGGRIDISSTVGVGTTVAIYLPLLLSNDKINAA